MARKKKSREMADGIMEGMREIQSWVEKGWTPDDVKRHYRQNHPDRIRTINTVSIADPGKHTAASVKQIRTQLGVSQAVFAASLGVSAILVQSWERGVREPSPLARRLLDVVSRDPVAWLGSLASKGSRRAG
jgi:DNA-binding transcriptional regulator YiaG